MNHKNRFFVFFAVLGLVTLSLMSCKKDKKDPTPKISAEEKAKLELLLGTWGLTSVTQNDGDVEVGEYDNLVLTVNADLNDGTDKTYTVVDGDYAFPSVADAAWSFVEGSNFIVIEREDGTQMRINELTETTLVLQQDVEAELAGGRVATIGRYIYTLAKQ